MFYKVVKKRVAPLPNISPISLSPEAIDLLCFSCFLFLFLFWYLPLFHLIQCLYFWFFRFRHYALAFHYISRRRFISFTTLPPALYLPSHPTHSIIIIVIMQGPSTGKPCNYIPQLLLHSKPLFFSFLYLGIFISLSLAVYLHFLYIYYKFGPKLS